MRKMFAGQVKNARLLLLCYVVLQGCTESLSIEPMQLQVDMPATSKNDQRSWWSYLWPFGFWQSINNEPEIAEILLPANVKLNDYKVWRIHKYYKFELKPKLKSILAEESEHILKSRTTDQVADAVEESQHANRVAPGIDSSNQERSYVSAGQGKVSHVTDERNSPSEKEQEQQQQKKKKQQEKVNLTVLDNLGDLAFFVEDNVAAPFEKAPNASSCNDYFGLLSIFGLCTDNETTIESTNKKLSTRSSRELSFPESSFSFDDHLSKKRNKTDQAEDTDTFILPNGKGVYVMIQIRRKTSSEKESDRKNGSS